MKELVLYLAKNLVDNPGSVTVNEISGSQTVILELSVEPDDLGKIIGRQGRTAKALRTLVNAAGLKAGRKVVLEIVDQNDTSLDR